MSWSNRSNPQRTARSAWAWTFAKLRRFATRTQGGAIIEATLVIPLALLFFVGIAEFAQGFTINRRLEAAAGAAADLVTRRETIDSAELAGIKSMLDEMIRPYPVNTLGFRVTSIVTDQASTATVAWSYAQGPGLSALTTGAPMTVPAGLVGPNASVVFAEIRYAFTSSLSVIIPAGIPMQAESYFPPRIGELVERTD